MALRCRHQDIQLQSPDIQGVIAIDGLTLQADSEDQAQRNGLPRLPKPCSYTEARGLKTLPLKLTAKQAREKKILLVVLVTLGTGFPRGA